MKSLCLTYALLGKTLTLALVSVLSSAVLLSASCGSSSATDPCAQDGSTCLTVRVSGPDLRVDAVEFALSGAVSHRFRRDVPSLPVRVPIALNQSVSGELLVSALGLFQQTSVAIGSAATAITPGSATEIEVTLAPAGPSCTDGFRNSDESDVDCGGLSCAPCALGQGCAAPTDCASGLVCDGSACTPASGSLFTVDSVAPANGPTSGNFTVTIKGTQFPALAGYSVSFGGTATTSVVWRSATDLTVTVPPRLGNAGQVDVVVTDPMKRAVTLSKGFRYDLSVVDFTAKNPVTVTAGDGVKVVTNAIATGSLNGDAFADFVLLSRDENKIYVFQGRGDGAFDKKNDVVSSNLKPFDGITAIALADMDGDGKTDLLVGSRSVLVPNQKAHVQVLLGNGDSTFKADTVWADLTIDNIMTGPVAAIGAADITDDNRLDVVAIGTADSRLVTWKGTSNAPYFTKDRDVAFPSPVALDLGDLAGSAKKDLAVVGQGDPRTQNNLLVLIDGGTEIQKRIDKTSFAAVALLDIDGDKLNDLVLGTSDTGEVAIRRGNNAASAIQGIATRADLTFSTVGAGPLPLGATDWIVDGKLDLMVLNTQGSTLGIAQGTGSGAFTPARSFAVSPGTACAQLVDLNNDGRRDVLTCNPLTGTYTVLMQGWQ